MNESDTAHEPSKYLYHGTSSEFVPEICRRGLRTPSVSDDPYIARLWGEMAKLTYGGEAVLVRFASAEHELVAEEDPDWQIEFCLEWNDDTSLNPEDACTFVKMVEDGQKVTGEVSLRLLRSARACGNIPSEALNFQMCDLSSLRGTPDSPLLVAAAAPNPGTVEANQPASSPQDQIEELPPWYEERHEALAQRARNGEDVQREYTELEYDRMLWVCYGEAEHEPSR